MDLRTRHFGPFALSDVKLKGLASEPDLERDVSTTNRSDGNVLRFLINTLTSTIWGHSFVVCIFFL